MTFFGAASHDTCRSRFKPSHLPGGETRGRVCACSSPVLLSCTVNVSTVVVSSTCWDHGGGMSAALPSACLFRTAIGRGRRGLIAAAAAHYASGSRLVIGFCGQHDLRRERGVAACRCLGEREGASEMGSQVGRRDSLSTLDAAPPPTRQDQQGPDPRVTKTVVVVIAAGSCPVLPWCGRSPTFFLFALLWG